MDCTQLIKQASKMNSAGVHALSLGNAQTAYQSFRQALQALSSAAALCDQEVRFMNCDESKTCSAWQATCLSSCIIPGLEDEGNYICDNALVYNIQGKSMNSDSIAICCHYTMFNLALTLHQRGISVGSQSNLLSAGRMYEQCLKLGADLPGSFEDNNVIKMAVLNNVAQLQYSLGQFEAAVETLQTIRALLQETNLEECVSPAITSFLRLDDLFLNILVTAAPTTAPCA